MLLEFFDNISHTPLFVRGVQAGNTKGVESAPQAKDLRTPFIPIRNLDTFGNAVILRTAEGGVAEFIIPKISLALRERGDRRRRWVRVVGEHLPNHSPKAGCGVMIEDFF